MFVGFFYCIFVVNKYFMKKSNINVLLEWSRNQKRKRKSSIKITKFKNNKPVK